MSAAALLGRLDKVRQTGPGRWVARCPGHDDRGPSLSIRELEDGRVLLHDFGQGCAVADIVGAVGLTLADLFPPHLSPPGPGKPHRERQPFHPRDILRILAFEGALVALAAHDLLAGRQPSPEEVERLHLAADRLDDAVRWAYA